jgi:hypothetical protein
MLEDVPVPAAVLRAHLPLDVIHDELLAAFLARDYIRARRAIEELRARDPGYRQISIAYHAAECAYFLGELTAAAAEYRALLQAAAGERIDAAERGLAGRARARLRTIEEGGRDPELLRAYIACQGMRSGGRSPASSLLRLRQAYAELRAHPGFPLWPLRPDVEARIARIDERLQRTDREGGR